MRRHHQLPRTATAGLASAVMVIGLTLTSAPFALAATTDDSEAAMPDVDWEVTDKIISESITEFSVDDSITQFAVEESVISLGSAESDEEDVIVLEADILFSAMLWDLSDAAEKRIAELAEEVPDGASVQVHGHTDSRPMPEGHEVDNQGLSENRAQAVADALAEARPDLELEVEGFGDTQPAETESEDDPGSYAANRRVEIRFG
ncbi:OmpA family protein [Citricoccus muralis]|uniref:OmpA family protein n=1 Tax=Citricoccus muralis TaxID=169134 RepID=A0ABY8H9X9_9MICC|nr:OmpA family protein [Citricoccus muralis]WFP17515.1 OmpA family protein [Citricoccus muralis]